MATLIAVVTSFYLYEWRRRLMESPHRVLPERWGTYLDDLRQNVSALHATLAPVAQLLDTRTLKQSEVLNDVHDTVMKLQGALDERDQEIRRLKRGYDEEIFRRFLLRFVRVDQALRQWKPDVPGAASDAALIARLLEDALEECGVEIFTPRIGLDTRTSDEVAENPKIVQSNSQADDHRIAEVFEPGYRLSRDNDSLVISPAKVSIYLSNT